MNILAVIPARGGSKGIPRKNVRLMNGKPLICYSIENALSCKAITDVVVTTDDDEISGTALLYGAEVIERDGELAGDAVTLDPVIYDATVKMEERHGKAYDIVITLQPTSPLLTPDTLNRAVEDFIANDRDTVISTVNKPHLAWSRNESGYYPLYEKRLNRQQLPPNYLETGAFFITRRLFVTPSSRMGRTISVFEVPEIEATDIDSASDWVICENILRRKKIVMRCDGYRELGMGHIYNCLTLAYNLTGHDIHFVTRADCPEGIAKIRASFMPCTTILSDDDFFSFLADFKPDIIVNDMLDTTYEYVCELKKYAARVVTIEDLGTGLRAADAVINALYQSDTSYPHVYSGERFVCLRDEFSCAPVRQAHDEVRNIMVIFGGTDPSNLTRKVYDIALSGHFSDISFTFLLGVGYDGKANGIVSVPEKNINVVSGTPFVSRYMRDADIAITSQGRTVFELASMGVPSVVMAQNKREMLHTFAQMDNGFLNLGLGSLVEPSTLIKTLDWLIGTPQIRSEMRSHMLRHDLRSGTKRVLDIILGV
ncbi:MAG: N-acylneuraminate cytidylyltransferase [Clostridia bacterium]|nr:N-acylneuraminate cytidylyltransferase [Clostridia bacterium]